MRPEKLVAMANQIATFFHAYREDEAVAGIATHLHAFWTPAMVATLRHRLAQDDTGVDPLVRQAMQGGLEADAAADSPIDRAASPLREAGSMATDAG